MILYHISPHENQDSIRDQGLLAKFGRGYGVWLSLDGTVDACQHIGYTDTEVDIWEIDTDDLDADLLEVRKVPVGQDLREYYRYAADIPARAVHLLDTERVRRYVTLGGTPLSR